MPKREVEPFIFNIFIFNSKCGPFKSWGHKLYVKLPQFLVLPICISNYLYSEKQKSDTVRPCVYGIQVL